MHSMNIIQRGLPNGHHQLLKPCRKTSLSFSTWTIKTLSAAWTCGLYLPPHEDIHIYLLSNIRISTILDANNRYLHGEIVNDNSVTKALSSRQWLYRLLCIVYALQNSPGQFHLVTDVLLLKSKLQFAVVHSVDTKIFSQTLYKHIDHASQRLTLLFDVSTIFKMTKFNSFTDSLDFLDPVIRPGPLKVSKRKIHVIHGLECPTTMSELWSFLGSCKVFCGLVSILARIPILLDKNCHKNQLQTSSGLADEEISALWMLKV